MKKYVFLLTVSLFGALAFPVHAAQKKVPSKISAYAGRSSGTCTFSSGGSSASGNTTGSFTTSHQKESGTLSLNTSLFGTGMIIPLFESYRFHNHSVIYTLSFSGASTVGSGTAQIGKNTISYFVTFVLNSATYTVQGTIRQSAKRLSITEVLGTNGSSATIIYSLKRHGHKKK